MEFVEPNWLAVMFRSENAGVEEHKQNNEPIESLRLDSLENASRKLLNCENFMKFFFQKGQK